MEQLVEFVACDNPRIEVFANEKAQRISEFLFGKFTENLGNNVYHGFWAQILRNTGFEPTKYFSHNGEQGVAHRMTRAGMADIYPDIQAAMQKGVACFWGMWGKGDVAYSLCDDRVNSETSQRIAVRSLTDPEVGIVQPVWLPAHRTRQYQLNVWVKGTARRLKAAIRECTGAELGSVVIPVNGDWTKHEARIVISNRNFKPGHPFLFTLSLTEPGDLLIDQCFLFPGDNISGFDPDVLHLLVESKLSMLRFPGGNFASGYHWKDGIGPIDCRPIRINPAWDQDEPNHVGTDEHIRLCRVLGCEPLICVNAGDGTPEEAAAWVEYCNGSPDSEFGRLRATNGHPEPYSVKYWEIGNELYGEWQIGHCSSEEYADRYRRFHDAMKSVDPTIKLIANGQDRTWNAAIIAKNADILRSLSTHLLLGSEVPKEAEPEQVYLSYVSLPFWFENELRLMGKQMADGGITDPKLAVTELQMFTRFPNLPNNQTLSEALVYAGMANAMIRTQGLVEIFTHSALVNHGGGIVKQREFTFPNPVYWAHRMYASQLGRIPVRLRISGPTFSTKQLYDLPGWQGAPYIDSIALLDDSSNQLNIIATNRHPNRTLKVEAVLHGISVASTAVLETLTGEDFLARNTFDQPDAVKPYCSSLCVHGSSLVLDMPPHSIVNASFEVG